MDQGRPFGIDIGPVVQHVFAKTTYSFDWRRHSILANICQWTNRNQVETLLFPFTNNQYVNLPHV